MGGLRNRTALVTASTGGIGLAVVTELARAGATVIVNGRRQSEVAAASAAVLAEVPAARLLGLEADVSSSAGFERAVALYPGVDVLVNNLGVYDDLPFFSDSDEQWRRSFDINVLAGVRLARHYLQGMLQQNWGRMVFVSSEAAIVPVPGLPSYSAAKAAVLSVSRSLAELTRLSRVTVNAVVAGSALTEGNRKRIEGQYPGLPFEQAEARFMRENQPTSLIGRLILPSEIASTVAFVCSEQAGAMNGSAVRVDGGIVRSIF